MSSRSVLVQADDAGEFTYDRPMFAMVSGIEVTLGTLGTPDIEVTDGTYGTELVALSATEDVVFSPWTFVAGTLHVVVTNAEPGSHGRLRFLMET